MTCDLCGTEVNNGLMYRIVNHYKPTTVICQECYENAVEIEVEEGKEKGD